MIRTTFLLTIGLTCALAGSAAAQAPAAVDPSTLGPQVGDTVPAFRLPDQHGQVRTFRSLMGPTGMMLIFSRATAW